MAYDSEFKNIDTSPVIPKPEPEVTDRGGKVWMRLDRAFEDGTYKNTYKKTTEQVLIEARDLIIKKGWGQGAFAEVDTDGKETNYCMLGAIRAAARRNGDYLMVATTVERILQQTMPHVSSIPQFNDAVARSKEEVLAAFNFVIKQVKYQIQ